MIGQSWDFSCLLTNFPGRIKKKHCARRKHSRGRNYKREKFLVSENGHCGHSLGKLLPLNICIFSKTFEMQLLKTKPCPFFLLPISMQKNLNILWCTMFSVYPFYSVFQNHMKNTNIFHLKVGQRDHHVS